MKLPSIDKEVDYTFSSRFQEAQGTNPEELIASAHAGCFSMALSNLLSEKGYNPKFISTSVKVNLEKTESGFEISDTNIYTEAEVPDIDEGLFMALAVDAKVGCPVSLALGDSVKINMQAKLV